MYFFFLLAAERWLVVEKSSTDNSVDGHRFYLGVAAAARGIVAKSWTTFLS
jgi:hypothetical protein